MEDEKTEKKDPNLERGGQQFLNKLASASLTEEARMRVRALEAVFADKVGIMATDGVYSAIKLSRACIEKATDTSVSDNELVVKVIAAYQESSGPSTIKSVESSRPLTKKALGTEYESATDSCYDLLRANEAKTSEFSYTYFDENGEEREKTIPVETINLTNEIDNESLSIEGHRSVGNIRRDYDTTSGESVIITFSVEKSGKIQLGPDGRILAVICPHCGKSDVISTGITYRYTCFECDVDFNIPSEDVDDDPLIIIETY